MPDHEGAAARLGNLRSPVRTVLLSIPDDRRRGELGDQLVGAGFRVLESSSWTAALDALVEDSADLGIVDAAIDDYDIYPPTDPHRDATARAQSPAGELPLIFLVDDPDRFDWDAYAQLDRAEVHPGTGSDLQLIRRVCALANRLDRQGVERVRAEQLRVAVRQIAASIRATPDPELIAERLVEGLTEVFGVDLVSVGTFDDDRVPALAVQWTRQSGALTPIDTSAHRRELQLLAARLWSAGTTMASARRLELTPPPALAGLFQWATTLQAESSISVPIGDGDAAFGLLWMGNRGPRIWSALEVSLLQHLAGIVAHQMMQGQVISGQREVLRRAERLDRAKSDFLAAVNHELRTPLTSLTAYLDLVQEGAGGALPVQAARMLSIVSSSARRLETLVDDVLTASRLAADDPQVNWAPVGLAGVVDQVLTKLSSAATAAGVELVRPAAVDLVVDGDAAQLRQVLLQLVDNAIKFTRPGGTVEIETTECTEAGDRTVRIAVTDSGVGIPADDVPDVFTSFFRGEHAQTGAAPGSGLGLAIVRGLVAAHGGQVTVEPVASGGTRVSVAMPKTRRGHRDVVDRLLTTD